MDKKQILDLIKNAIYTLYDIDNELFARDLCERCLVHRLAVHLGREPLFTEYIVDCEFNKAFNNEENKLKRLSSENGNYVDIIAHRRSNPIGDNLFCIEVKKKNNRNKRGIEKDKINLGMLTSAPYFYRVGIYINLGDSFENTSMQVYDQGKLIDQYKMTD